MFDRDCLIVNLGKIEFGWVYIKWVEIKDVGKIVKVRNEFYEYINYYIKMSKFYFLNEKLCVYIYCLYFLKIVLILGGFSIFGGIVVLGVFKVVFVCFFVVCLLFFMIFC